MPQNTLMLDPIMEAIEKANATDFVDSPYALAQQLGEGGKGKHPLPRRFQEQVRVVSFHRENPKPKRLALRVAFPIPILVRYT